MSAYQTLKEAIEKKSVVTFTFHGEAGFGSPHSLGTGDGEERVLLYRGEDAHEKKSRRRENGAASEFRISLVCILLQAPLFIQVILQKATSRTCTRLMSLSELRQLKPLMS
ncbi:hypothetical protein [Gluconobacter oxydans]|uniref:hypothetical protein n=1 Tax=Gluconobacter oxydans TaxID=442 RepID=UPI0038D0BCC6